MSEEGNSVYDHALQSLQGMSVETLTQLGAQLSSIHPQELPIMEKDYFEYSKEHSGAINVLGIAQSAHNAQLNDISKMTKAVQTYVDQQRKILNDINAQFKALRHENEMNATKKDDEDSKQQKDLKHISNSEWNNHYVDLLAKNMIEDMLAITDRTIEELHFAVEKHKKLLDSLEDTCRVERNKGGSSSSSKPKKKKIKGK